MSRATAARVFITQKSFLRCYTKNASTKWTKDNHQKVKQVHSILKDAGTIADLKKLASVVSGRNHGSTLRHVRDHDEVRKTMYADERFTLLLQSIYDDVSRRAVPHKTVNELLGAIANTHEHLKEDFNSTFQH